MYPSFPDWYRLVNLNPQGETIQNRWKAIESKAPKFDADHICRLVTFFVGKSSDDQALVDELNKWFQDADPTFSIRNNELELQILSGSMLACVIEDGKQNKQLLAGLSVLCSAFGTKEQRLFFEELKITAEQQLRKQATEFRDLGDLTETDFPQTEVSDLKEFSKQVFAVFRKIERRVQVLAEESNIGWWLVNAWIKELNSPVDTISRTRLCLVAGKELADLCVILPEPVSARAVLARMLANGQKGGNTKITIPQAVNATTRAWRESVNTKAETEKFSALTPISYALKKSLETTGESDWVPSFERGCQQSGKQKYTQIEIAHQFYRECLLFRALTKAGNK